MLPILVETVIEAPTAFTVIRDRSTHFTAGDPVGTWDTTSFPIVFHLGSAVSRDVGAEAAAELDVAIRTWPFVPCTSWRASYGGVQSNGAADDGVNMVLFHDDVWPAELIPGVVAQTVAHVDGGGRYRDADIHLNGVDFKFSLDGAPGTLDLRSILTHEIGHALGLGHSADPRATMFPTGSGKRWRSLEKDDRDGVCSLYPGMGAAGCGAETCPSPFLCVAGECQRPGERDDVCSPCERVTGACEAAGDDARCIDLPGGRVCGRACAGDGECGAGFRCLATSTSGNLQCVSDVNCANGASPCTTDADCKDSACRDHACVALALDAGADASSPDASPDGGGPAPTASGGGCACSMTSPSPSGGASLFLAALFALVVRSRDRTRRRTGPACRPPR